MILLIKKTGILDQKYNFRLTASSTFYGVPNTAFGLLFRKDPQILSTSIIQFIFTPCSKVIIVYKNIIIKVVNNKNKI